MGVSDAGTLAIATIAMVGIATVPFGGVEAAAVGASGNQATDASTVDPDTDDDGSWQGWIGCVEPTRPGSALTPRAPRAVVR